MATGSETKKRTWRKAVRCMITGHKIGNFYDFIEEWVRLKEPEHYSFTCADCGKVIQR